jgi:hypothetical protein
MTGHENPKSEAENVIHTQMNDHEEPENATNARRSDSWAAIAGAILIIFGVVLAWDSMLWLFPQPYGVPCSDWKELMIALPVLSAGWLLALRGKQFIARRVKWFAGRSGRVFPLTLSVATLLICAVFSVEIHGTYWFARSTVVKVQEGWGEAKYYSIRLRYALPDDDGHCEPR